MESLIIVYTIEIVDLRLNIVLEASSKSSKKISEVGYTQICNEGIFNHPLEMFV